MDYIKQIKWRIKEILIQKNISIYQLANKTDLSGACIRNWYSKRNYTPSLEAMIKVCEVLEISPVELFREDTDEMVYVNRQEKELLSQWAVLNEKQKKAVTAQIEAYIDK